MNGRHVGYVRVSTHEQNTVRQLADCKVDFWKIYEEKASGKNTDRPELQDCLSRLDEGDTRTGTWWPTQQAEKSSTSRSRPRLRTQRSTHRNFFIIS